MLALLLRSFGWGLLGWLVVRRRCWGGVSSITISSRAAAALVLRITAPPLPPLLPLPPPILLTLPINLPVVDLPVPVPGLRRPHASHNAAVRELCSVQAGQVQCCCCSCLRESEAEAEALLAVLLLLRSALLMAAAADAIDEDVANDDVGWL